MPLEQYAPIGVNQPTDSRIIVHPYIGQLDGETTVDPRVIVQNEAGILRPLLDGRFVGTVDGVDVGLWISISPEAAQFRDITRVLISITASSRKQARDIAKRAGLHTTNLAQYRAPAEQQYRTVPIKTSTI